MNGSLDTEILQALIAKGMLLRSSLRAAA